MKRSEEIRSAAQLTDCVCPGCGRKHQLEIFWTGKIPARKNCHSCKNKARIFMRESIHPMCIHIMCKDLEVFLYENEDK